MAALLIGLSGLVASLLPFLRPSSDPVGPADAVVVLSGDRGDRLALGRRLVREGVAPVLVLAGEPDFAEADRLCQAEVPFEVVCLRPRPDSTRAEARAAADLATRRGWDSLVVATSEAHVSRTRLLFERCVEGNVAVVGTSTRYEDLRTRIRVIAHEWLGFLHASTAARQC